MPRTLARLRYRKPLAPITFTRRDGRPPVDLEQRVAEYVVRQSNPRNLKLQVVVNPKARLPPTGQTGIAPIKPYTLKDVVDPEGTARHGEIIYIFRNNKTNQIIYSLQELLNDHHLAQLPFIGKHSTPPVLRPDEWEPHCVITFPTVEQGRNAYRQLREFRKLHELSWEKTNPEWKHAPLKQRMKKIMNQRANMSADLAEVLRIQEKHGEKMTEAINEREQKENEILDKKWAEIDALANAAVAKENVADSVKWLEHQIRSLNMKLNMKHNKNEADQKRLTSAKIIQEIRLKKIQYALRKADQFKSAQEELARRAAPANELGAEGKLNELKDQALVLKEALANPDPSRTTHDLAIDRELLASRESEIATLEQAFEAKAQSDSRDHHIARSILPRQLKKSLPTPYTLDNVSIQWVDIRDALFASGQWPEMIEHDVLAVNKGRSEIAMFRAEDFAAERDIEVGNILQALQAQGETSQTSTGLEVEPEAKKGFLGKLFGGKDTSTRATA